MSKGMRELDVPIRSHESKNDLKIIYYLLIARINDILQEIYNFIQMDYLSSEKS